MLNKMFSELFLKIVSVLYFPIVCHCVYQTKCLGSYTALDQEANFVDLTNETRYKKWMRPQIENQIIVNTSVEIYSMASLNEKDSEFALNLLLDLVWNDPRLLDNHSLCEDLADLNIEGSEWHLNRIWSPKLRVPNNKNSAALDRDAKIILLRVSSRGNVRVRKRLTLDVYCEMDFHYYPFDEQMCEVKFVSSDLSEDHLLLNWEEKNPLTSNNLYITGFDIELGRSGKNGSVVSKGENFSTVTVTFKLKRLSSHYLLKIYLPTVLVIIVSWISFWMDITATPARITLGVTTMLTFVTVGKDSREDLPNISYANALDIWFAVCTGFIFFSLIEFIIITYISRAEKRKLRQMKSLRRNISQSQLSLSSAETQTTITTNDGLSLFQHKNLNLSTRFPFDGIKVGKCPQPSEKEKPKKVILTITPPDSPNPDNRNSGSPGVQIDLKLTPVEIAEAIDRKCRLLFPLAFFTFNLIYWLAIIV